MDMLVYRQFLPVWLVIFAGLLIFKCLNLKRHCCALLFFIKKIYFYIISVKIFLFLPCLHSYTSLFAGLLLNTPVMANLELDIPYIGWTIL